VTLDELFTPEPLRWGLRGDPHLWEAMRLQFIGHAYPADEWEMLDAVRVAFEELTGAALSENIGHLRMQAFSTGSGMSDGWLDGNWWHEVGLALLLDRWHVARTALRDS
jgi:hypothetical protein